MDLVVDTNVLVSGALWGGTPRQVFSVIRSRRARLWFSHTSWAELTAVLRYPKLAQRIRALGTTPEHLLELLRPWAQLTKPDCVVDLIDNEPIDNALLAIALTIQADALISGDRHLLRLRTIGDIPILAPAEFVRQYR